MATTERHEAIRAVFLDHAEEEFEKDDMLQASEKAWGAVAHYVKSVAKANGWSDGSHRDCVWQQGLRSRGLERGRGSTPGVRRADL